jgi:DNA repair exonuclease SbcCD ATPase subunit
MGEPELNEVKTDIALIKKDISQIERLFSKLDKSIDIVTALSKSIAIQENTINAHDRRLVDIDFKITQCYRDDDKFRRELQIQLTEQKESNISAREAKHKEVMQSIKMLHDEFKKDNDEQDARISKLEELKWWSMGVGASLVAFATFIWQAFFG